MIPGRRSSTEIPYGMEINYSELERMLSYAVDALFPPPKGIVVGVVFAATSHPTCERRACSDTPTWFSQIVTLTTIKIPRVDKIT